jgi:lipoic acid synthetase
LSDDASEPGHVVEAVARLGLRHVVITSVTRDDLPDGGANQFAKVIEAIRNYNSEIITEVLIPDFQGSLPKLKTVVASRPTIINHNVETVPRLYPEVRPQSDYGRSIELLIRVKSLGKDFITKSGLMVGFGEEHDEVIQVMQDLRKASCDFLTVGQYLQPSLDHHEVVRFVSPAEFEDYRKAGIEMGFKSVAAAPFVRSSFHADMMLTGSDYSRGNIRS